jgi:uncharacterized protein YndB with AHSA1/START domain
MEDALIRVERQFNAPADRVFRAWRDPKDLEQWAWGSLGCEVRADVDFRQGGKFCISTSRPDGARWSFSGVYTEIVVNRRVSHTLNWDPPMVYEAVSECVTVEFVDEGEKTTVVFLHEGVPSLAARDEHVRGWINTFEALETLIENESNSSTQR